MKTKKKTAAKKEIVQKATQRRCSRCNAKGFNSRTCGGTAASHKK